MCERGVGNSMFWFVLLCCCVDEREEIKEMALLLFMFCWSAFGDDHTILLKPLRTSENR